MYWGPFYFPYRWDRFDCILKNLWHGFRYDIPHGIKNLAKWIPIIWHDQDWDNFFLDKVVEFKIQNMLKSTKYWHGISKDRDARDMRICLELFKRLEEDDYLAKAKSNPFGWDKLTCYHHSDRMESEDRKYLYGLIGKRSAGWWD